MVIRINELKLSPDHTKVMLEDKIRKVLRLNQQKFTYEIIRQSIDARKKPDIYYVYMVDVQIDQAQKLAARLKNNKITLVEPVNYMFPFSNGSRKEQEKPLYPPVVVGSGPAGLFCALMLARAGFAPVVLERGECVEDRIKSVEAFWESGVLQTSSNVQFGEGGAGTFSDGKLNTQVKSADGKVRFVLKEFVRAGAPEEICYQQKPHIGTDVLAKVVHHIREELYSLGATVRFSTCLTGITVQKKENARLKLELNHGEASLETSHLVTAIGHSARDTFEMLLNCGIVMQPKAFAVGLRMEHKQEWINQAMYGSDCPYEFGAAPYKVTHKCQDGRGVYSFCMCPGGYVVNASSEDGRLAVNGMSYSDRGSENANSAIVVTITPEDYQADSPLSGMEFQRKLEERAFACGNGRIPVQRLEDFCANTATKKAGTVHPQQKGQYRFANVREILPEDLNQSLLEGIAAFSRQIPEFAHPDALLSGVESRTSSPVRMLRDDTLQASVRGIYPCGEGAGYAGGITSAAVDGIRIAEALCRDYMAENV